MSKVFIIAEAGVNHNGDLHRAKSLIETAKMAGADAVKFQTYRTDNLVTPDAKKAIYQDENDQSTSTQYEMLRNLELSYDEFRILRDYAIKQGIEFLSTPFDHESVDFLIELGLETIKVSSADIDNIPLLRHIAKYAGHTILSSGMATTEEVKRALALFPEGKVSILQCVTSYPAAYEDIHLRVIPQWQTELQVPVGFSDHSPGIHLPCAAVAMGATIIEKHFTTDRYLPGPDHKASLEPDELKQMISDIRQVELSLGSSIKSCQEAENVNRQAARRSLMLRSDLKAGTVINHDHVIAKRPATGISPADYDKVIGKTLAQDTKADQALQWDWLNS